MASHLPEKHSSADPADPAAAADPSDRTDRTDQLSRPGAHQGERRGEQRGERPGAHGTDEPARQPTAHPVEPHHAEPDGRLVERSLADRLQRDWSSIQAGFVDDPQGAIGQADRLADEAVEALHAALTTRKRTLDQQWQAEGERGADTERMRLAFRGYRDLVDDILTA